MCGTKRSSEEAEHKENSSSCCCLFSHLLLVLHCFDCTCRVQFIASKCSDVTGLSAYSYESILYTIRHFFFLVFAVQSINSSSPNTEAGLVCGAITYLKFKRLVSAVSPLFGCRCTKENTKYDNTKILRIEHAGGYCTNSGRASGASLIPSNAAKKQNGAANVVDS